MIAINSDKVSTNDSRLSDSRTPKSHTHDERYYTETEISNLLNKKQNKLTSYFYLLNATINSKNSRTGNVTRQELNMPTTATPIWATVIQYYDGSSFTTIAQNLFIAYSLNETGNNVISFRLYNNDQSGLQVNVLFKVLAYL